MEKVMSDRMETAIKVLAQRIEDLQAENQKLHGWVASAEATAGKLQGKINAYEERREVDLIVLYSALHFAEFCWRDVPMNEYAFERCEELIAKLRKQLK